MENYLFGVLTLLLVVMVVLDVLFGKQLRYRNWLQAGVVVLYVLAMLTIPRCTSGDPDRPDGPQIPYSF